jgi:hypothetical protein
VAGDGRGGWLVVVDLLIFNRMLFFSNGCFLLRNRVEATQIKVYAAFWVLYRDLYQFLHIFRTQNAERLGGLLNLDPIAPSFVHFLLLDALPGTITFDKPLAMIVCIGLVQLALFGKHWSNF